MEEKYLISTPNGYLGRDGFTNSKPIEDAGVFTQKRVNNDPIIKALLKGDCGVQKVTTIDSLPNVYPEIRQTLLMNRWGVVSERVKFDKILDLLKRMYG